MPLVSRTFDQIIDFTRTSAGTFVGSNGLIQNTAASRNLLTFTQEFDNAAWQGANTTVTANSTIAPDGTRTADTFTDNAVNGPHNAIESVAPAVAGQTYTMSLYAKASTSSVIQVLGRLSTMGTNVWANFNLANGTVGATGPSTTASIVNVGNGWYRCIVTGVATGTGTGILAYLLTNSDTNAARQPSYVGTGTGVFIWGAQVEQASTATDYTRNFGGVFPPRFDFDPVTLAPRGLLIEEQRTNLLTYSERFDDAFWFKNATTVTANSTAAPDGTMTADTLTATASNNRHSVQPAVAFAASGVSRAISIYVKAGTHNFVQIYVDGDAAPWANFNLATGAVGSTGTNQTATITPVGNGWYRCVVATTSLTATDPAFVIVSDASAARAQDWTTAGTESVFIWGAQLETGSFATSYIPTVASQVTRTADIATINAPNFAPWYRADEGTIVFEYVRAAGTDLSAGRVFASGVGGSNSYGIWVNQATGSQDQVTIRDISGDAVNGQLFNVNSAGVNKGAVAYKVNDFAWASNGGAPATDNTGVVPSLSDQLRLGRAINTDSAFLNGHIRSIRYYPVRLSNAQLQALTA